MKEQYNPLGNGYVHFNAHSFATLKQLYYDEFDDLDSVQFDWLIDFLIGDGCEWMQTPEWIDMYQSFQNIKTQYIREIRNSKIDLLISRTPPCINNF